MIHWTRSGDVIIMGRLGGMGTVVGPVLGAIALLVLEEITLSGVVECWQIDQGRLLPGAGIDGTLAGLRRA